MTTSIIARVNNVDIMSISDERLVPIKPICEALGIDSEAQRQKIQSHYLLAPTALLCKALELMETARNVLFAYGIYFRMAINY